MFGPGGFAGAGPPGGPYDPGTLLGPPFDPDGGGDDGDDGEEYDDEGSDNGY